MRVIIITDDEAPIVLNLSGRSHDDLDELHDEVIATLAHLFMEAHDAATRDQGEQDMELVRSFWEANDAKTVCTHRDFSHGTPESGIRSSDCVKNGTLS